ncbi:MAG: GNAT family N-acetyltransferase [Bacteroidia bacterium]|nr:GNAT family N-acetyltransferase [Bacteroidia bacterium]
MERILETERLYLRAFIIEDAPLLIDLNSDPEVTRYTGDGPVANIKEAERILKEIILPQYPNKIGRWAVHLKANEEFIGWCGIKFIQEDNEYDLGYRFYKKHWGKGYATESANAVMDYAKNNLQLEEIIGRAAIENTASIHVLKKMGMTYLRNESCGHDPAEVYIWKKN